MLFLQNFEMTLRSSDFLWRFGFGLLFGCLLFFFFLMSRTCALVPKFLVNIYNQKCYCFCVGTAPQSGIPSCCRLNPERCSVPYWSWCSFGERRLFTLWWGGRNLLVQPQLQLQDMELEQENNMLMVLFTNLQEMKMFDSVLRVSLGTMWLNTTEWVSGWWSWPEPSSSGEKTCLVFRSRSGFVSRSVSDQLKYPNALDYAAVRQLVSVPSGRGTEFYEKCDFSGIPGGKSVWAKLQRTEEQPTKCIRPLVGFSRSTLCVKLRSAAAKCYLSS